MFPLFLFWRTHVDIMSGRSIPQHPSHFFFFFFHGPNFLPSAERERADGAANLAVGPGRSVRDPVRYWAAIRRGGGDRRRSCIRELLCYGVCSGVPTGFGDWLLESVDVNTQTSFTRLLHAKTWNHIPGIMPGIAWTRLIKGFSMTAHVSHRAERIAFTASKCIQLSERRGEDTFLCLSLWKQVNITINTTLV